MTTIPSANIQLYVEDYGSGVPVVFVHEFSDDLQGWEFQFRYLSRGWRCVRFNARGYPPSAVPDAVEEYSQEIAALDIRNVMDGLGIDRAHIVGLSMGAFAAIHFGLNYPERARSVVATSCGYGTEDDFDRWSADVEALAAKFESDGPVKTANDHASSPYRIQLQLKDRRTWTEFRDRLANHSIEGAARTLRGVHKFRPPLVSLEERLRAMRVPLLIIAGDEDEPCLEPALFLKRAVPTAALAIFPRTGHSVTLEEPILFTETIEAFMNTVDRGRWEERDIRTLGSDRLGLTTAVVDAEPA